MRLLHCLGGPERLVWVYGPHRTSGDARDAKSCPHLPSAGQGDFVRAQLAEWIIPPDDWKQVFAQVAATPGLKQAGRDSQRRRTLFSVLAWTAATSGEPFLAPIVRATPRRASQLRQDIAQARYHARARPTQFPAALARAAESYGANLAAAIDSATAAPGGRP